MPDPNFNRGATAVLLSAFLQLLGALYFQLFLSPVRLLFKTIAPEPEATGSVPQRRDESNESDINDHTQKSEANSPSARAQWPRKERLVPREHGTANGTQGGKAVPGRNNRSKTHSNITEWPIITQPRTRSDGTTTSGSDTVIATYPTKQSIPGPLKKFELRLANRSIPSAPKVDPSPLNVPKGTDPTSISSQKKMLLQRAFRRADTSRYKYQRINADQCRLMVIRPGEPTDEVNAVLVTISDEELGSAEYPYEALSYHWGEGEEDKPIVIQNDLEDAPIKSMSDAVFPLLSAEGIRAERLYVRPNLHAALTQLRSKHHLVPLWVDALCINQRDNEEKKDQVMKMAQIYRKSGRVCIWLGPENLVSYQAMRFIKDIIDPDKLGDLLSDTKYLPQWAALFELLKWSWFSRRWVIQELALAKQATVHCGNEEVHWNDLKDAIGIFHKYFKDLKPGLNDPKLTGKRAVELEPLGAKLLVSLSSNVFRRGRDGTHESTIELETLVCLLAGFDTSDPRDTMIALRNISKELNPSRKVIARKKDKELPELPPEPNYKLDLYQTYQELLFWIFNRPSAFPLDILCRHWALPERPQKGPTTPRLVVLPSWILTVDEGSYGRGEDVFKGRRAGDSFVGLPGKHCYHASPHEPPKFKFGEDHSNLTDIDLPAGEDMPGMTSDNLYYDMSLTVSGLLIGVVNWASDPIPDGVIPRRCLEKFGWQYPKSTATPPSVPAQLWRTLVADRGPEGGEVPPYYERACLSCLMKHSPNGHINTEKLLETNEFKEHESFAQEFLRRVQAVTWNRVCLEAHPPKGDDVANTSTAPSDPVKLVGLGPSKTQDNDVIAIFYGCSVPVILRPRDKRLHGQECYEFIGEAYIYGKMDGEAEFDAHIEKNFRLL